MTESNWNSILQSRPDEVIVVINENDIDSFPLKNLPALKITDRKIPLNFYLPYAESLRNSGVQIIHLYAWAWKIDDRLDSPIAEICDYIYCHTINPLTQTSHAKKGAAFIDMSDSCSTTGEFPSTILWHTDFSDSLPDKEILAAKNAGCSVASPVIAPFIVAARFYGLKIFPNAILNR